MDSQRSLSDNSGSGFESAIGNSQGTGETMGFFAALITIALWLSAAIGAIAGFADFGDVPTIMQQIAALLEIGFSATIFAICTCCLLLASLLMKSMASKKEGG